MADDEQSAEETGEEAGKASGKQAPTRPAKYNELVEDRENLKRTIGHHLAETEERQSQLLAAVREPAEELKAAVATIQADSEADRLQRKELSGAINGLVAFLGENAQTGTATAGAGNGEEAGAESTADTEAAGTAAEDGAAGEEDAAGKDEPGTVTADAGEENATTDTESGEDGEGAAGKDAGSAGNAGREEPVAAGSDAATAGDSTATGADESATAEDEPAPSAEDDVPEDAAADFSPEALARALAERLPLDDVKTSIEAIREAIISSREGDEEKTDPGIDTVIQVLSAVRGDLDIQAQLIQALHRNPPPKEGQDTLSTDHAMTLHDELMKHMDQLIVRIAPAVSGGEKKDEKEQEQDAAAQPAERQDRLPPTGAEEVRTAAADLSTQLRAEGSAFRRFAWVFALVAIPMAVALGIVAQREFGLMPALPETDPTGGWKDIVWEDYGEDISHCRGMENAGVGPCVVTVTPPAQ